MLVEEINTLFGVEYVEARVCVKCKIKKPLSDFEIERKNIIKC